MALPMVFYQIATCYSPAISAFPTVLEKASCEVAVYWREKMRSVGMTTIAFLENVVAEAAKLATDTDGLAIWRRR
jgi:phage gp36-like protein